LMIDNAKEAESTFAPNIFVIHDTIIMRAS